MFKPDLVDSAVNLLSESGFKTVDCRGSRSSFDILAKRGDLLLLIKALANVEGLGRESVLELRSVSSLLNGTPLIVSERMKSSSLADGIIYDRYGVCVSNLRTFSEFLNDAPPRVYSTRGNYCVRVNVEMLSEARRRRGLTQDSLAERIMVSKQSIYRYESCGRMSLEVFERLKEFFGDELAGADVQMRHEGQERPAVPSGPVTSFKRMVCREFEHMGFETHLTSAPFDMVAKRDGRVFSVVSNDWRRLEDKLEVLREVSETLGGYGVCISRRRVEGEVSVLTPGELSEIKSPKDLFKLLSD
jgi:putative transcriptional regulator